MKKLCYICEATAGGVRKHLGALLHAFSAPEEGYTVHAFLGDRGEPGFQEELEALRKRGVQASVLPELSRELRWGADRAAYAALKGRLRELRPDLVHTHSAKAGFLGRLAAHAVGVPRILHTPHVFPFQWSRGLRGALYLALERYAAKRCQAIVCVGAGQREDAQGRGVTPAERLILIPNGVAIPEAPSAEEVAALRARWSIPREALAVGMVARLAPQKGVGTFLNAAVEVLRARPETVFLLAGAGPLEREVRARAAALGLERERLKILGHVAEAERLYPAFDVLALSSLYEGLPYVLLEAMACGVPVVATDVLGSRDALVDEESGLLAHPEDPSALAAKVLRLLEDSALRARMGQAGRERVRTHFSLARFLEGHRRIYRGDAEDAEKGSLDLGFQSPEGTTGLVV